MHKQRTKIHSWSFSFVINFYSKIKDIFSSMLKFNVDLKELEDSLSFTVSGHEYWTDERPSFIGERIFYFFRMKREQSENRNYIGLL